MYSYTVVHVCFIIVIKISYIVDCVLYFVRKSMRLAYTQLYELNKDIMRGYEMRRNNHMELLECLRIVNQAIQRGARLRGEYS